MRIDADVLIVGAGPTGLMLAVELQRRGVGCLLIDAHDRPLTWDRATVVHPRSIEIFDSLGLADRLLKAGVKQRTARIHSNGKALGEVDLSLSGSRYPFNLGVSEEVTEAILTAYLVQLDGAVTRSTRLIGLDERDDGVLATLASDGVERQVFVRWVVGCDGHHSTVRSLTGIEQDGHDIEEPWAVFDTTIDGWPHSHEANYAYLDEPPIILTALPDERWRVYLRPSSEQADLVADATRTLRQYVPDALFTAVANPTRFRCHTKVAAKYRSGRLLIAGDAAHTCSPIQGHGMNSGLQDAFNLAWKLALVCKGVCSEALLDSYEAERRPVAQMFTASGDEADHAQMLKSPDDRRARDEFIRGIFANRATRHQEAVAEAELNIDYGASPIVMGLRHDALAAGQLWPSDIEIRPAEEGAVAFKAGAGHWGHIAIVIGGDMAVPDELSGLRDMLDAHLGSAILEASMLLATQTQANGFTRIDEAVAERLGVRGVALFVVRPDGYLGLRADQHHGEALAAYAERLGSPAMPARER
ncbi:FAD-dependent monooxygenase [Ancylobacter sp. A5.8]|uniref:FAD-dependent monooxygenase n=1 Tax=Ancylobacter gelatini TaxID=2919920 RepID=UPI001F4D5CF8|nr:FAD-dependent monooxygenase [Ancylobacter gelatini]MCJ8142614.1 FAD-dependent monooxygenase [Ancylobacter gelatini]